MAKKPKNKGIQWGLLPQDAYMQPWSLLPRRDIKDGETWGVEWNQDKLFERYGIDIYATDDEESDDDEVD